VIERVVRFIPPLIWLALVFCLLLALIAAAAALRAWRRARRQAREIAAVSAVALTDPLTGVLNRRGFLEAAERELARSRRHNHPFVLAYIDVRGLKAVNDTEGHLAGDRLLREAASLLEGCARSDDVVGRLGGDEMGLLLVEPGPAGAAPVLSRLRAQVALARRRLALRSDWDLTVGTATFPGDGRSVAELLAAADRRLYEQRGIALR
jgi:diguanylate cyclase (GGDEF)-like protein